MEENGMDDGHADAEEHKFGDWEVWERGHKPDDQNHHQ